MPTQKPFKTYRQQLKILRGRNLSIPNGEKAIKILRREGYYNIVNGYKDIFLDEIATKAAKDDRFKNGVTFDNIFALYDFDRNMRALLLNSILKMETGLKTKIAYYFSEKYKGSFSYLDISNFDASDPQKTTRLISKLSAVITNNSQQGGQVFHYLDKYKELPLWVLIKKMTLGETYHFFDLLSTDLKQKVVDEIALCFYRERRRTKIIVTQGILDCFSEMLMFLNRFRNICAHGERLYNTIVKQRGRMPGISLFHVRSNRAFNSKLFDCFVILGLFLDKRETASSIQCIRRELDALSKRLPPNLYNEVLRKMGFPKSWDNEANWF